MKTAALDVGHGNISLAGHAAVKVINEEWKETGSSIRMQIISDREETMYWQLSGS